MILQQKMYVYVKVCACGPHCGLYQDDNSGDGDVGGCGGILVGLRMSVFVVVFNGADGGGAGASAA